MSLRSSATEESLDLIEGKLTVACSKLSDHSDRLARLEAGQVRIELLLTQVLDGQTTLQETIADLKKRLSGLKAVVWDATQGIRG